jgi:phosphate transport system substrate-binding protein
VSDGSYPISRPLFIYVNNGRAEENPVVAAFVDFFLSDEGIGAVEEEGYVPVPADQLEETRSAWTNR